MINFNHLMLEGVAAPVFNTPAGFELVGGGNQVYLDNIQIPLAPQEKY